MKAIFLAASTVIFSFFIVVGCFILIAVAIVMIHDFATGKAKIVIQEEMDCVPYRNDMQKYNLYPEIE